MPRAAVGSSWLDYTLHGGGEPVLMIMGMGATQAAWAGQVDLLQRDHQLLTFDNRGMGESGPIEGRLSMRSMARDALSVLDHAGWETAHVVGISMGGMIAQELALMAQPRLRSLSLLTTHGGGRGLRPLPTARGLGLFVRQRVAVLRDDPRRTELLLELLFPPEVLAGPIGQATSERIDSVFGGKHSAATLQAQTVASTLHHTLPRLRGLQGLPTLVVRSARDLLVHPKAQARLHRAIPDAKLLNLQDAGHGALAQCADEIADALRGHIAEAG
jgi:3-oxoadipate enol-lactonase